MQNAMSMIRSRIATMTMLLLLEINFKKRMLSFFHMTLDV